MPVAPTPDKQGANWRKHLVQVLTMLAVVYVMIAVGVMVLQRRLIYFPTKMNSVLAEALAAKEGFRPWLNSSGELIGWNMASRGTATGTVLVVHGNAGCALDRGYLVKPLHDAAALDVYVLEYPGYGSRTGSPSQHSILAAAEQAFALLPKQLPVYIVSESLGAGVAAHLAKVDGRHVSGLMFFVPYDKLASVGQRQMRFLPVSWLLWDRFEPSEWLKDYRGPAGFVLAGADQVIPPEFGRRLYDGYRGPKRLQLVPGAGHNDVATQSSDWWREVLSFWQHP